MSIRNIFNSWCHRGFALYVLRFTFPLFILMLAGCGDEEKFEIRGEVAGKPTMNLYMRYYGNDRVMQGVTPVKDGEFEFFGMSKLPTIVEIMDNEYRILGRVSIANKQSVYVKLDRHNPYKIQSSGTKINEDWSKAVNGKADSLMIGGSRYVNCVVEDYISQNPKNLVSTLMYLTMYDASQDPFRADSVLQSIDPEARIGRILDGYATVAARFSSEESREPVDTLLYRPLVENKVKIFSPDSVHSSLIVLTSDKNERKDSIVPMLKRLAEEYGDDKLRVLDIMLCADTAVWRRTVKPDSATWEQGWMPGGIFAYGIDRLSIPTTPYFILIDSLGNQLHRSPSVKLTENALEEL